MMNKTTSRQHLRYASIAFCFVFLYFLIYNHPVVHLRDDEPPSQVQQTEVQQTEDQSKVPTVNHPDPYTSQGDILSPEQAERYCGNFRLKALPRAKAEVRKIYDLLLVNTELEMLDVRLGQMSPGVDYFVILEGNKTFTNKDKPLYVKENWDRYEAYHDKIILRTMDLKANNFENSWARENAIRNAMYDQVVPFLAGVQQPSIDDVLLVSDIDEMFKPETLKALRNCDIPQLITAQSRMFYYSFQWLQEKNWPHPQATLYKGPEDTIRPDDVRYHGKEYHVFEEGGWHCSYCFSTMAEMVRKIGSFSHTELDKPEFTDPRKIIDRVRRGSDM
jgi:beta-1,4-mannosyl-glycoprotein beta-1,4-N-acetylglucosaminyltransferase